MSGDDQAWLYAGARKAPGQPVGMFRKAPGEARWEVVDKGLPAELGVQAIAVHPENRSIVFMAGTDGAYRSDDHGNRWEKLPLPVANRQVWSFLIHPRNPNILYLGTAPVGVLRSDDGGANWRSLPGATLPEYVKMPYPNRVVSLQAHPLDPDTLFAGMEVGGVMRSTDAGETWRDLSAPLIRLSEADPRLRKTRETDNELEGVLDIHALSISEAAPESVFLASRLGLFRSDNRGEDWIDMRFDRTFAHDYSHDITVSPTDAKTLYTCMARDVFSEDGWLFQSRDLGANWSEVPLGRAVDGTAMALAFDPARSERMHLLSMRGQVLSSADGGVNWSESRLPGGVTWAQAIACG